MSKKFKRNPQHKSNQCSHKKNKYNSHTNNPRTNIIYLLPVLFVIAILPLITHMKVYTNPLSEYPWFSQNNEYVDFFLYFKQQFFIGIGFIMVILLAVKSYINKHFFKFTPIFIPLAVYALLALLSSIFSKYRSYSFHGIFDQFESVFVIMGYCLIVYYIYLFINTERDIKLVINCLLASVLILGILGLTQILSHDFFTTERGLKLITSRHYWDNLDTISFRLAPNTVYLTLFNPNYVGVYVSLILPIFAILFLFVRKIRYIPIYLLALASLILCLIGSRSATSLVCILISLVLTMILLRRYLVKYIYVTAPLLIFAVIALLVFNPYFNNTFAHQLRKFTNIQKSAVTLNEIQTNEDGIIIRYKGNSLKISYQVDEFNYFTFDILDDKNNYINRSSEVINGPTTLLDERYPGFVITPFMYTNNVAAFSVLIDGHEWIFTNQTEDGTYYYVNGYIRFVKLKTAPSSVFTGYERLASGRGYIWSRTIPLLKNHILLGSGADSYVFEFPQNDYVNLYNFGFGTELINKPHSLYLQIGVQTGVLSLLSYLIFYGIYFVTSIRLYINDRFNNYYSQVGVAILIGTFSYMIASITNDSTITVAPVFWVFMGLGITVNKMAKTDLQNKDTNNG